jgi:uncharacterized membrane protein
MNDDRTSAPARDTGRLEAFSDGVFAIAITLLVLDLRVPTPSPGGTGLLAALLQLWPTYLAFVTSFATILIMWVNHHVIFRCIARTDQGIFLLNGLLLLCVAFVPFPTSVLSAYFQGRDQSVAAAFYSGTFAAIALAFNALWHCAVRRPALLDEHADPALIRAISQNYRFGPPLDLLALLVAFVSGAASFAICMAMAVFFALPSRANRAIADS